MQLHDAAREAQSDARPSGLVEKKGVKMFSVTSAGIAPPLLLISMTTCSAASMRERISISPSLRPATASRAF